MTIKKFTIYILVIQALTSCVKYEKLSNEDMFKKCLTQAEQTKEKSIVLKASSVKSCMEEKNFTFNSNCRISQNLLKELPHHSIYIIKQLSYFCYTDSN
jgi:hypothetical protein